MTNSEISLIRELRGNSQICSANELFDVNVGIVSGENDFFLLNEETRVKYSLNEEHLSPIVGRADQLRGIIFSNEDFDQLIACGRKVYLFSPADNEYSALSKSEQSYIDFGVKQGYNSGDGCTSFPQKT